MKQYIRYEIEERRFSSNVITGVYLSTNSKGEQVEKTDRILSSFLPKEQADEVIMKIYKSLNELL